MKYAIVCLKKVEFFSTKSISKCVQYNILLKSKIVSLNIDFFWYSTEYRAAQGILARYIV